MQFHRRRFAFGLYAGVNGLALVLGAIAVSEWVYGRFAPFASVHEVSRAVEWYVRFWFLEGPGFAPGGQIYYLRLVALLGLVIAVGGPLWYWVVMPALAAVDDR